MYNNNGNNNNSSSDSRSSSGYNSGREDRAKVEINNRIFTAQQKRHIADEIQRLLRETNDPNLPEGEIMFSLRVTGKESYIFAIVRNNGAIRHTRTE